MTAGDIPEASAGKYALKNETIRKKERKQL